MAQENFTPKTSTENSAILKKASPSHKPKCLFVTHMAQKHVSNHFVVVDLSYDSNIR
jgi:hypothetical protein